MPATVTVNRMGPNRREIVIAETLAGATDEVTIANGDIWIDGEVILQTCTIIAGTGVPGATVDPILGTVTNPSQDVDIVVENGVAAANVSNLQQPGVPYRCQTANNFFHRSRCSNATADHTIETRYIIARPSR